MNNFNKQKIFLLKSYRRCGSTERERKKLKLNMKNWNQTFFSTCTTHIFRCFDRKLSAGMDWNCVFEKKRDHRVIKYVSMIMCCNVEFQGLHSGGGTEC
jgi:hypothetical protein